MFVLVWFIQVELLCYILLKMCELLFEDLNELWSGQFALLVDKLVELSHVGGVFLIQKNRLLSIAFIFPQPETDFLSECFHDMC